MFKNVIRKTTLALNNHTITSGILRPFCYFPLLLALLANPAWTLCIKLLWYLWTLLCNGVSFAKLIVFSFKAYRFFSARLDTPKVLCVATIESRDLWIRLRKDKIRNPKLDSETKASASENVSAEHNMPSIQNLHLFECNKRRPNAGVWKTCLLRIW